MHPRSLPAKDEPARRTAFEEVRNLASVLEAYSLIFLEKFLEFGFRLPEDFLLAGVYALSSAVDVEIEHRHCRLIWCGFAS